MITHSGIITRAHSGILTVNIKPEASECGSCALTSLCKKNEEIEVAYPKADASLIGREITVGTRAGVQRKGILLFFAVPIMLLIVVMAITFAAGISEGIGAAVAIAAVAIWYFSLYLMRVKIQGEAQFTVIRID